MGGGAAKDRVYRLEGYGWNFTSLTFVGFRNSKWIVSHGISLNVCNDLSYFKHIVPCGDPQAQVTSIATELGRRGEAVDQDLLMRMAARHVQTLMLSEFSVDRVEEADLDEFMLARQALGTQEVRREG